MTILTHSFNGSAMLNSCEYDTEKKELFVEFSNGKVYTYEDVDPTVYANLTSAPSAGKYFNMIKKELKLK